MNSIYHFVIIIAIVLEVSSQMPHLVMIGSYGNLNSEYITLNFETELRTFNKTIYMVAYN